LKSATALTPIVKGENDDNATTGKNLLRDCDSLDVEGAVAELERAGYEVIRMPAGFTHLLGHPLDYFIEAIIAGRDDPDEVWEEVDAIVDPRGGMVEEKPGFIGVSYQPFIDFFSPLPRGVEGDGSTVGIWRKLDDAS